MYLTVAFLDHGLSISPGSGTGPEFHFMSGPTKVWVEAVAPGPGTGSDRVLETILGVNEDPTSKILVRFANALAEKRARYQSAVAGATISPADGYVLAINSRRIPQAAYGNTLPYFLQALLPFGDLTLALNRQSRKVEDAFYSPREAVSKANQAPVGMRPFLDPEFAFVSAVLHSAVDCVNRPERLGGEFSILHNPLAACPLNPSTFSWCDQYFYRDGDLEKLAANGLESAAGVAMGAGAHLRGSPLALFRILTVAAATFFMRAFVLRNRRAWEWLQEHIVLKEVG